MYEYIHVFILICKSINIYNVYTYPEKLRFLLLFLLLPYLLVSSSFFRFRSSLCEGRERGTTPALPCPALSQTLHPDPDPEPETPHKKAQPIARPGDNSGAKIWFPDSTLLQMLPESGSICKKLTKELPSTRPHEVIKANNIQWTSRGFVWRWGLLFANCP